MQCECSRGELTPVLGCCHFCLFATLSVVLSRHQSPCCCSHEPFRPHLSRTAVVSASLSAMIWCCPPLLSITNFPAILQICHHGFLQLLQPLLLLIICVLRCCHHSVFAIAGHAPLFPQMLIRYACCCCSVERGGHSVCHASGRVPF